MQIAIPLSRKPGTLSREIYQWFRNAALDGTLRAGDALPSTRDLADQLRVSRTVVLRAYEQLLAEGYAEARSGSGTYIAHGLQPPADRTVRPTAQIRLSHFGAHAQQIMPGLPRPPQKLPYDFNYNRSATSDFPFDTWRRMVQKRAHRASRRTLDYGLPAGSVDLREAIAAHLARSRAVVCDASQVIIVNGSQQALDLAVRILMERGDHAVIEDPAYQGTREILRAAGAQLHPLRTGRKGWNLADLPDRARLAFLTPSHQFPTGAVMPLAQRLALLEWAKRADAVIIEDDYDGEFHYDGRPLESMQGLDTEGRVIYVGTFSRTMFPALRIGYMVAPRPLAPVFAASKWLCDRHTPTLEQHALADFITEGAYERHLRRRRRANAARRDVLVEAVERYLDGRATLTGAYSGNHVVLWPVARIAETELVANAEAQGVGLYGLGRYYLDNPPRHTGLFLGYTGLRDEEIREGIHRLSYCLPIGDMR